MKYFQKILLKFIATKEYNWIPFSIRKCNLQYAFAFLDNIKTLTFTSWWVENGEKNLITVVFRLDGNPHEIIIKDTKYYVKELYSADKRNTTQL